MYKETFKESWKTLSKNLELFAPDIVFFIVTGIIGLFLLYQSGLLEFFNSANSLTQLEKAIVDFIYNPDLSFILDIIFYLIIFLVTTFFVGSGTNVAKYFMMREVLLKKNAAFSGSLLRGSREFYFRYIGFRIAKFFIVAFGILTISLIYLFLSSITSLDLIKMLIFIFIILPFIIFTGLLFYFSDAVLFLSKRGINDSLRKSYELLRNKFKIVIITFFIVFLVNFIASLFFEFLQKILGTLLFITIINVIVVFVLSIWGDLFVFKTYSNLEKIKR